MKTVSYSYGKYGYTVSIFEAGECIYEYQAGNHKLESDQITDIPEHMIPIDRLKEMAGQTAKDIADENDIPHNLIDDNGRDD